MKVITVHIFTLIEMHIRYDLKVLSAAIHKLLAFGKIFFHFFKLTFEL